jgi:hypothetical protein
MSKGRINTNWGILDEFKAKTHPRPAEATIFSGAWLNDIPSPTGWVVESVPFFCYLDGPCLKITCKK